MTKKQEFSDDLKLDFFKFISAVLFIVLIISGFLLNSVSSEFQDYKQKHPENSINFQCDVEMQDFIDLRKQNENLQEQLESCMSDVNMKNSQLKSYANALDASLSYKEIQGIPEDYNSGPVEAMDSLMKAFSEVDEIKVTICVKDKSNNSYVDGCFNYNKKENKFDFKGNISGKGVMQE